VAGNPLGGQVVVMVEHGRRRLGIVTRELKLAAYAYHLHPTAFQCIVNVEKKLKEDTPELISGSQLFNSSIHSFITQR
jgi:hypothetical protein